MTYNVEALQKLRERIVLEAASGHHDQAVWGKIPKASVRLDETLVTCPTTACAAGWTVTNAGAKMIFRGDYLALECRTPEGCRENISDYAAQILGLNSGEAYGLFLDTHTTEDVLKAIDELLMASTHRMTWEQMRERLGVED